MTVYALGFAAPLASGVVGMVAAGMVSDRRGPAMPLLVALTVFGAGLLLAGAATSMELFVAGRVLQGLGGGAATVVLYVVIGLIYPTTLQASVFASLAAAWVLPSLFGPAVAAVIADAFGWRWVFLGTVVLVALVGVGLARRVLGLPKPSSSRSTRRTPRSCGRSSRPPPCSAYAWSATASCSRSPVRRWCCTPSPTCCRRARCGWPRGCRR
ncbi:MFS transporter [Nocardioides daphniae]|uniref:MFS transporter n=1 Tax=Nocardioides daphniae TaxID=402297 RepID=A0A4P7UEN7_9ACTN|nr:MFS transporter [Nocardioides daphniae]QCC78384.1 MFS transporter [Nocardioides daphniae]